MKSVLARDVEIPTDAGAQAPDAPGDAQPVARVLQHFLRAGTLNLEDFAHDRGAAA